MADDGKLDSGYGLQTSGRHEAVLDDVPVSVHRAGADFDVSGLATSLEVAMLNGDEKIVSVNT